MSWEEEEGTPSPLGVSFDASTGQYNFAIYSKHASQVELLLFGGEEYAVPTHVHRFDWRRNKTGRVWHCRIGGDLVELVRYYAFRVDGPRDLGEGHRFDGEKLLLDPYARAVHFPPGFSRSAASHPGANPGSAPLGRLPVRPRAFDWGDDLAPRHEHDAVIYEVHVRGFTKRSNSGVAPDRRGTFAGLIDKIPYLKELGVTIVELMPVFQFDPQEGNYWGYMPLSFFAVHAGYGGASDGGEIDEFKALVKALHGAGIEVLLDVVYNHTAEGNETGPTYSFRGIDNSTYYFLEDDRTHYRNDSGTGNVLHTANRSVQCLVLDSLRYWAAEMRVDGFRFDLASLFTRNHDGSINLEDPPILTAIHSDPVLSRCRLIAEAWDMASYQLGRSFPGIAWLQWNGRFRDEMRSFLCGGYKHVRDVATRLYGSADLFPDTREDAYRPFQSLNFITSHDGFCLNDLFSYDRKHNEANGEENRDGTDANYSCSHGWEGEEGAPAEILEIRRRQAKNAIALLMLANGTPMLVAGDEFLKTKGGNNNPYNQDNETNWLDWSRLDRNADFFRFVRSMIAFRKAHPSIARSRFWRDDVDWQGPKGPVDWDSPQLAYLLHGANAADADLYVMINGGPAESAFAISNRPGGWHRVLDTALPPPSDFSEPGAEPLVNRDAYVLAPRSLVVLMQRPEALAKRG